jgi:hypothetical protein
MLSLRSSSIVGFSSPAGSALAVLGPTAPSASPEDAVVPVVIVVEIDDCEFLDNWAWASMPSPFPLSSLEGGGTGVCGGGAVLVGGRVLDAAYNHSTNQTHGPSHSRNYSNSQSESESQTEAELAPQSVGESSSFDVYLRINGSSFVNNAALAGSGGAVCVQACAGCVSTLSIVESSFRGNEAVLEGGAVAVFGSPSSELWLGLSAVQFHDNRAAEGSGGAVLVDAPSSATRMGLALGAFMNNSAGAAGGAMMWRRNATTNSECAHVAPSLENVRVGGNSAPRYGPHFASDVCSVTLSRPLRATQPSGADLADDEGGVPQAVLRDWYGNVVSTEDSRFQLEVSLLSGCTDYDACCFDDADSTSSSGYVFHEGVSVVAGVSVHVAASLRVTVELRLRGTGLTSNASVMIVVPPTSQSSGYPSALPTSQPSIYTGLPTLPTGQPSNMPSGVPSALPTGQPTLPTGQPSALPTGAPTTPYTDAEVMCELCDALGLCSSTSGNVVGWRCEGGLPAPSSPLCGGGGGSGWGYVGCDELDRVTYLSISSVARGTIPSSIGSLERLEGLYIYLTSISGTIPSTIGSLKYLKGLSLWNTQLSGSIPSSIGQLSKLLNLQLAFSSFSGSLPETLGSLTQLLYFEVKFNYLSGTLPETLGSLTNLYYLDVSSNCFTGTLPESLAQLRSPYYWVYIDLYSNRLQGKQKPRSGCHIHIAATIDTLITIHTPTDARHMPSSY